MNNSLRWFGFLMLLAAPAAAQVGHPPERSPYRDLDAKQAASFVSGYLGGSRGSVNVGPSSGPMYGIRYDHIVGVPLDIQVALSVARLKRYVVDASQPVATRTSGPIKQDLAMMEAGVSLIVMGRKTWHGFAPFVGGTVGVGFETGLGTDPSGYQFGTKVLLAPHAGFKWYPVQALAIKVEARSYFWRLSYPTVFAVSSSSTIPTVLPSGTGLDEWTAHPTLLISLGYTFARF